jgi:flavodoxin
MTNMRCLVVYYTRTGITKAVAETVAAELGADLEEIVDLKKREGKLGWLSGGRDAMQKKQTEIASTAKAPCDYDLIILGTPIWAWAPTPAFRTYVAKNGLGGRKVAVFYTYGSDPKQASEKIHQVLEGVEVVGELALKDPSKNKAETEKQIAQWCQTLKQ